MYVNAEGATEHGRRPSVQEVSNSFSMMTLETSAPAPSMFSKLRGVVLVVVAICLIGVFFVYEFDLKDAVVDGIMGRNGTDDDNVPVASRSAAERQRLLVANEATFHAGKAYQMKCSESGCRYAAKDGGKSQAGKSTVAVLRGADAWYSLTPTCGMKYTITVTTKWRHLPPGGGNGNLDPRVFVYGVKPGTANSDITKSSLKGLAENDDFNGDAKTAQVTVPCVTSGRWFIAVGGYAKGHNHGEYTLTVPPPTRIGGKNAPNCNATRAPTSANTEDDGDDSAGGGGGGE